MADVKMTKAMWLEEIKGVVEAADYENKEGAIDFINKQIETLAAKAEKAKEKAAKAKAEGDELRAIVEGILTADAQPIDDIVAQIEGEDVTKAKVTARLTALVNAGIAKKEPVKVGSRKVMAYSLK
jgi:FixJ family two-component response regulator